MSEITKETRKESYKKIELKKKTRMIYDELDKGYTARELAEKLYKKRIGKNCRKTRNSTKTNRIGKFRIN